MFDNLFWLMGPVGSALALFGAIVVASLPAWWTTCSLSRGGPTFTPRA